MLCGMVMGRAGCNGAAAALISGAATLSGSSTLSDWLEDRGMDTAGSGAGGNGAAGGRGSSDLPVSTCKNQTRLNSKNNVLITKIR